MKLLYYDHYNLLCIYYIIERHATNCIYAGYPKKMRTPFIFIFDYTVTIANYL